jgi:hypothetical protein
MARQASLGTEVPQLARASVLLLGLLLMKKVISTYQIMMAISFGESQHSLKNLLPQTLPLFQTAV